MSWNYKYWRRRSSYDRTYQPKPKYYYSEKEIDFTTENFDYDQFFLQEFFTSSKETRNKISTYYIQHYGPKAHEYLERKYIEWANGDYHLTEMMRERFVSVMPHFLTKEAKYKLGIHEFLSSIKGTVNSFQTKIKSEYYRTRVIDNATDIIKVIEMEFDSIQAIKIQGVKYDILSENEKTEILEISKYILLVKLQHCIDQIVRDFNVFIPLISNFRKGVFSVKYHISRLNLSIDISCNKFNNVSVPKFIDYDLETDSRFKMYADKYFAWELVTLHKESNNAICNSFLNNNDINLFYKQYEKLMLGENIVDMKSTFQGEGGILELEVKVKPVKIIKHAMMVSTIKLIIAVLATIISITLIRKFNSIGIYLGIFLVFFVYFEIKKYKSLIKELEIYG